MSSIRTVSRSDGISYVARIHRRGQATQSQTFHTLVEAKTWATATEAKIDKKENVSRLGESLLFKDICAEYLRDYRKPKGGAPCTKGERLSVPRLATHFKVGTKISEISRAKLEGYIPALMTMPVPEHAEKKKAHPLYKGGGGGGRTYSGNTARKYFFQLKKVLVWAAARHKFPLDANLFEGIGIPGAWEKPRERRLEEGEEERLINAGLRSQSNGKQWRLIILFAIVTAARSQEILKAQWKEFNLPGKAWNIPKEHSKTKTARQVTLSTPARVLVEELAAYRKKTKSGKLNPDELIFPWWKNSAALAQAFKRLTARAGLADFTIHDLRHEGISRLFQTQMSDIEIMKMTGHTNASTLVRYSHIRASDVAEKIDAKWSAPTPVAKAPSKKSLAKKQVAA